MALEERLGTELPADAAYVLLGVPVAQLKKWASDKGLERVDNQNDLVQEILENASAAEIDLLYQNSLFSPTKVAVTWFRGIPRPSHDALTAELPRVPFRAADLAKGTFSLVWAEEREQGFTVRMAFRRPRRAIRSGLGFLGVEGYGFVTLLWRPATTGELLEVHADHTVILQLIERILPSVGCDAEHAEVLDLTSDAAVQGLRKALDGRLEYARWHNDTGRGTADQGALWAKPAMSLDDAESEFVTEGHSSRPGRGRRIECKLDNRRVTVEVSQLTKSTVLAPMNLEISRQVLEGAITVGTWGRVRDGALSSYAGSARPRT